MFRVIQFWDLGFRVVRFWVWGFMVLSFKVLGSWLRVHSSGFSGSVV